MRASGRHEILPPAKDGSPRAQWVKNQLYALAYLTYYGFVQQYNKAALGVLWFLITPILLMLIYGVLMTGVYEVRLPGGGAQVPYSLLILAGLLPWMAFADGLGNGAQSIVNNPSVLRHSPLPPLFLPTVKVVQPFLGVSAAMLLLVSGGLWTGDVRPLRLVLLPPTVALLFCFTLGLAWALSALAAYVRDVVQLVSTLLLLGIFASPVFYTPDMTQNLSPALRAAVALNPMSAYIALTRAVFVGSAFDPRDLVVATAAAALSLLAGWALFRRLEPGLADCV